MITFVRNRFVGCRVATGTRPRRAHLRFLGVSIMLASLSGCLRYVPARDETLSGMAGAEEFYSIEKNEKEKLASLLGSRKSLYSRGADVGSYRIGVGDVVDLKVFDVPELNSSARVRPDGNFSLPLIGEIHAENKTESELQADITQKLKKFVTSPSVNLFITSYEGRKVSAIGEVTKPGVYPLKQGMTSIVQVLSEAGGRTARAANHIILLPSTAADGSSVASQSLVEKTAADAGVHIDMDDLLGTSNSGVPILVPLVAGDTIVVPEAGTVEVDGEVVKPGSYPISSKESILGAVAAAGGFTYSADVEKVEVIREINNGKKAALSFNLQDVALKNGKDVRLRNGDVVRVPSAAGRFVTRQTVDFFNKLINMNVSSRVN